MLHVYIPYIYSECVRHKGNWQHALRNIVPLCLSSKSNIPPTWTTWNSSVQNKTNLKLFMQYIITQIDKIHYMQLIRVYLKGIL
jgi:hypothetical protein